MQLGDRGQRFEGKRKVGYSRFARLREVAKRQIANGTQPLEDLFTRVDVG